MHTIPLDWRYRGDLQYIYDAWIDGDGNVVKVYDYDHGGLMHSATVERCLEGVDNALDYAYANWVRISSSYATLGLDRDGRATDKQIEKLHDWLVARGVMDRDARIWHMDSNLHEVICP